MLKRIFAAVMTFVAMLCFTISGEAAQSNNWLIYWYVCGTDIESSRIAFGSGTNLMSNDPNSIRLSEPSREPGDVTRCINEIEKANLSPNVKIFMQAGGTYIWGHEKFRDLNAKIQTGLDEKNLIGNKNAFYKTWYLRQAINPETIVSNGKIGRYLYDKIHRNWIAREKLLISGVKDSKTDMGSPIGLVSFLRAGQKLEQELYPDGNVRRVLIMKNHGGPTPNDTISICSDAYTNSSIHLDELQVALNEVNDSWTNLEGKPFEAIVFDACEMSSYETAMAVKDAANYMVASQETTWGRVGLNYTELLNKLSQNTAMNGKTLGKIICDTRWTDSQTVDKEFSINATDTFTFSVIDLSEQKMDALKKARENFDVATTRLIQKTNSDEVIYTFSKFRSALNAAEKYPSNSSAPTLVDLKNFTDNLSANFPELQESNRDLIKALDNAVIYNKRGSVLNRGGGLSVYYHSPLYEVLSKSVKDIPPVDLSGLKNVGIEVDPEKKTASIEISEEDLKNVESVRYQLLYILPRNDGTNKMNAVLLGSDSDVEEDRQNGTLTISFKGKKWFTLNNNPLCVQVVSDATRKGKDGKKVGGNDICVSSILFNGEPYKLFFSRRYPNEKITIIGVVPDDDNKVSLPNDDLKSLQNGDVVIPMYPCYKVDEGVTVLKGQPIKIGDKPIMEMKPLYNGIFAYMFEFVNPLGGQNTTTKEGALFRLKNGEIVKVLHSDDFDDISDLEK